MLRFFWVWFLMELLIHCFHVTAISKVLTWTRDWQLLTPLETSLVAYWNLNIIWLKLMTMWRFFRLWSLGDGIVTVENMNRCMNNNYSFFGFWRQWHRSFNRWLVRYMYVPMGGGQNTFGLSFIIIFTFVAVWHDQELNLMMWGWSVCLFLAPEFLFSKLCSQKRFGSYWFYRHLCAVGAAFNIAFMMIANLIGFSVGVEGVRSMLKRIVESEDYLFLGVTFLALYSAAQIMFEIREEEKRRAQESPY